MAGQAGNESDGHQEDRTDDGRGQAQGLTVRRRWPFTLVQAFREDWRYDSIGISERRESFCDVHYHPWMGEVEAPSGPGDTADPIAIAPKRHADGSNGIYSDGHARWSPFSRARAPFFGHELFGEFQAF